MQYQALHTAFWGYGAFWVLLAVLIFAALAGRRIWAAITKILDARTQGVREALEEAARLKAEAQAMLDNARAAQAQAVQDAKQIVESAHAAAVRMAEELAADAKAAAKWRERMALERIAAAELSAVRDVRAAAIDVATAATGAMLREHFTAQADAGMIDAAIAGVPEALRRAV